MNQPTAYTGRPLTPAPGAEPRELRIARVRPHARRLFWSALVLIVVAGAVGYFSGNLPAPLADVPDWALWAVAGVIIVSIMMEGSTALTA